jgi:hypothetical protein
MDNSLFAWQAEGFSYQSVEQIEAGKGYWVLATQDCQLTVGGTSPSAAPQKQRQPEQLISLKFTTAVFQQQLELGVDSRASTGLDRLDRPAPPLSPHQSSWVRWPGEDQPLLRDIRSTGPKDLEDGTQVVWPLQVCLAESTRLSLSQQSWPQEVELVLRDGAEETILQPNQSLELRAGQRELSLIWRPKLPTDTQLLQNYPNPFNPETWIPFDLSEEAKVTIDIYDGVGDLVRRLSIGQISAGAYRDRERAAYWDGKNESGEQIASGVYFYQIRTGNYREMRQMVILK